MYVADQVEGNIMFSVSIFPSGCTYIVRILQYGTSELSVQALIRLTGTADFVDSDSH